MREQSKGSALELRKPRNLGFTGSGVIEEDEASPLWRFHASHRGHGAVHMLEMDERKNAAWKGWCVEAFLVDGDATQICHLMRFNIHLVQETAPRKELCVVLTP